MKQASASRRAGSLIAITIAAILGQGGEAAAQSSLKHFDIAGQPLSKALTEFARQSDRQILFSEEVAARETQGIKGELEPEVALRRLLKGTGLTFRVISNDTILIESPRAKETAAVPGAEERIRLAQADSTSQVRTAGAENPEHPETSEQKGAANIPLEEIVVTGSNIRTISNATIPGMVFTREAIERTGYSRPQELFASLPQNFSGGGVTEDGIFGIGANSGQNLTEATALNLRGLGPAATLFLIDGKRVAPTVFGSAVDISLIPLAAVDRIEIVTDGSSAVYGSDAVAGVVNVRMRRNYEGAETRVRYGATTQGGRDGRLLSQTLGKSWTSGNALLTAQYQEDDALRAADRSFRGTTPGASQLLPESRSVSSLIAARQQLSADLELSVDALISRRDVSRFLARSTGDTFDTSADADSDNFSAQLAWHVGRDWDVTLTGSYSSQHSTQQQMHVDPTGVENPGTTRQRYRITSGHLVASGSLFGTGPTGLNVAFGAEYREERERNAQEFPGFSLGGSHRRDVVAAFAEGYYSLIRPENSVGFIHALDLSGSLRRDDYSDFGRKTTHRVGVRIAPAAKLNIRGSYSTSFRAPNTLELSGASAAPGALITLFASPEGGAVPAMLVFGGGKPLDAETADIWSVGFDYALPHAPNIRFGASYYDIDFSDRIVSPPFAFDVLLKQDVFGPMTQAFGSDAEAQAFLDHIRSLGGIVIDPLQTDGNGGTVCVRSAAGQCGECSSDWH